MDTQVRLSDTQISEVLRPYFKKWVGGTYHAHLNGSDITLVSMSRAKWKWTLDGRQSGHGWSKSLTLARVDSWRHTLNGLERAAESKGELSIP